MMYEPRTPPKMTISEAISHQTANRGVGIPAALRVVAIGLADIVDSIWGGRIDPVPRLSKLVLVGRAGLARFRLSLGRLSYGRARIR
jgi:hypothetical protein